jgi:Tol biopolymer transport system component
MNLPAPATVEPPPGRPTPRPRPQFQTFRWRVWLALLVGLGLAGWAGFWVYQRLSAPSLSTRLETMSRVVQWAGEEADPRLSPDGQWVSFLSTHEGAKRLWLRSSAGGDPVRVATRGDTVISHAWSPDSHDLACLAPEDRHGVLQVVPARTEGMARVVVDLGIAGLRGRVVRWAATGVFLDLDGALWRLDPQTAGPVAVHLGGDTAPTGQHDFDVSLDGRRAVFAVREGGSDSLWLADIGGGPATRLTEAGTAARRPRWAGSDWIVYQRTQNGQSDLWEMHLGSRQMRQLTMTPANEMPADATADGSVVAFERVSEHLSLWTLDPVSQLRSPLPGAGKEGGWQAMARDGTLAFQLANQIMVMTPATAGTTGPQAVADGYAPRLSADGRWLAFLKTMPPEGATVELWTKDLRGHATRRVTDRFVSPGYDERPHAWTGVNLVWGTQSADLYYVSEASSGVAQIERARVEPVAYRVDTLVQAAPGTLALTDLRLSADEKRLAYLALQSAGRYELHVRELATGRDTMLLRGQRRGRVRLAGWHDSALVLLRAELRAEGAERVEIAEVGHANGHRVLTVVDSAFIGTAVLDAAGALLYLTRSDAAGLNLYVFSFEERTLRRLTALDAPGPAIAAPTPIGNQVLYTQQNRNREAWLIRLRK